VPPPELSFLPWEANIDVAAHLRDNPTHSVRVVEERQGATSRK